MAGAFGIAMVKDEEDILPFSLPRMAHQLDHIIVADNMSTDRTRDILEACERRYKNITIVDDDEPAYLQSSKMSALACMARDMGAEWVVPFDADEVWVSATGPLSTVLSDIPPFMATCHAQLFDHVVTGLDDENIEDPILRLEWRRADHVPFPKVAGRPLPGFTIEQGNHGWRYPGKVTEMSLDLIIHHFPYRSVAQMARKARNGADAYAAAGERIPASWGQHWRDYGRFLDEKGIAAIEEIFTTWFYEEDPRETLLEDPCPVELPV